ncbi:beta-barrel assembly-enhancing protease [Abditibacteriota bacterium]|nr:beta-barrel assembly-enhancing protease [Abditibacteriota bacterium]
MICGRCGKPTAENSTFCPQDRWAIFVDRPESTDAGALFGFDLPVGSGLLARRRQESRCSHLQHSYEDNLQKRNDALEKRLESEPDNFEVLRALGLIAYLENQFARSAALLERAHKSAPDDLESSVNYAIVLARRGQLQPSLSVLNEARQKHPRSPLVWLNLALVALQAHRPPLVFEAVDALEQLWLQNPGVASDFHDDAVTVRGLALLLEKKPREAWNQLNAAARHAVNLKNNEAKSEDLGDDLSQHHEAESEEADEAILEGKGAQASALNNLALAEAEMGELNRAQARLRAALRLEPGNSAILNNIGVLAYRGGNLKAAYRALETAHSIEEFLGLPDPITNNHLGVVFSALGRMDESLTSFQRAGASEHAEFEVFYNLGRAFIEHGRSDMGVPYLRQAFNIEPNNPDVHTVLGAAYLYAGRINLYAEALKHLKRAVQIDSHHRTGAADLIMTLLEIGNKDAARSLLAQAIKIFPSEAEPNFLAALIILNSMEGAPNAETFWANAAQRFETARAARPETVSALYNSALCQFMMGFRDTASKLLEAAIGRDPSLGPAYYLIGLGHAMAGRNKEALAAWKIAAQLEPHNVDVHFNTGSLLYRAGDFTGSCEAYMRAHRLEPTDPIILACLGVAFARRKMFPQAIAALDQSIQINPRSPIAHSNIGLAYYLFNAIEKAMEHWRMVSQLDRDYAAAREEEQQRSFDDSIIQLRPIEWRSRIVGMAPVLPRPHTRLTPAQGVDPFRLALTDPKLAAIVEQKRQLESARRLLGWMNLKHT